MIRRRRRSNKYTPRTSCSVAGAVGHTMNNTYQPNFGEAGIEFFQHALHFANGDRIECQQGTHDGGVGGPGLAVGHRLFR